MSDNEVEKKIDIKTLSKDDQKKVKAAIFGIVENLDQVKSLRDETTELVTELESEFGIPKPISRSVAQAVFANKISELEEKNKTIVDLIDVCI